MKEFHIDVPGAKLKVFEYGLAEPPVILIHGGPCIPGPMRSLGDQLKDSCHVIEYYQRGAADSPSDGQYGMDESAGDLHSLVTAVCQGQPPVLIGHSCGAVLALVYAARYSQACRKAILLGTGPLDKAGWDSFQSRIISRITSDNNRKTYVKSCGETKRAATVEEAARIRLSTYPLVPDACWTREPSCLSLLTCAEVAPLIIHLTAVDYEARAENNLLVPILSSIACPVVAIHGDYDPIPHESVLPLLKQHIPSFRAHLLSGAGHFAWIEHEAGPKCIQILKEEIDN